MNKKLFPSIFFWLLLSWFMLPKQALAFCPVCVVATGAGVELFRWLGVDDTIIGLWLGGFNVSITVWLSTILNKKRKDLGIIPVILAIILYLATLGISYWFGFFNNPYNKLFGVNKLILGIIIGSLLVAISYWLDLSLRRNNNGKVRFYYQKIIIPVSLLFFGSLVFYLITQNI